MGGGDGEDEFVVVAVGQAGFQVLGAKRGGLGGGGNHGGLDRGGEAGGFADVKNVLQQAVGDVDGGGGDFFEGQVDAGGRQQRTVREVAGGVFKLALACAQAKGGVADGAGDVDGVAGAGAIAAQGLAGRDVADEGGG